MSVREFLTQHWNVWLPMAGSGVMAVWGLWRGWRRDDIDQFTAITKGAEATVSVSVQVVTMLRAQIDETRAEVAELRVAVEQEQRTTRALWDWIESIRRDWAVVRKQIDPPTPPSFPYRGGTL